MAKRSKCSSLCALSVMYQKTKWKNCDVQEVSEVFMMKSEHIVIGHQKSRNSGEVKTYDSLCTFYRVFFLCQENGKEIERSES